MEQKRKIDAIDVTNECIVGRQGDAVVIMRPPNRLTRERALTFAAWLVAMADDDDEFSMVLDAVQNT